MKTTRILALAAGALAVSAVHASPVGSTVRGSLEGPGLVGMQFASSAVVGDGVEFFGTASGGRFLPQSEITVDLDATGFWLSVERSSWADCPFACYSIRLDDLDGYGGITDMTLASGNPSTLGRADFTTNAVTIWVKSLEGQRYRFEFTTDDTVQGAVPEPTTAALVGTALLALGLQRKARTVPQAAT